MIRAFVGLPGAGKTASMVAAGLDWLRKSRGQIVSNMAGLRLPASVYLSDLQEVVGLQRCLCLLDEAGVCLSSRYWQSVPREVLMQLAQVRHDGVDLYYTAQHMARVDTVLRELTAEAVVCRPLAAGYVLQLVTDPGAGKRDSVRRRRVVRLDRRLWSLYDSYEVVGVHGGTLRAGGARIPSVPWAKEAAVHVSSGAGVPWVEPQLMRWYDGHGRFSRAARAARDWLRSEGLESGVEDVRREVARRAWLAHCGLSWTDVPVSYSFDSPWVPGYGPSDVVSGEGGSDDAQGSGGVDSRGVGVAGAGRTDHGRDSGGGGGSSSRRRSMVGRV
jgi:uncharacterized membrane protein YgcG